jgi:hypothetical protein
MDDVCPRRGGIRSPEMKTSNGQTPTAGDHLYGARFLTEDAPDHEGRIPIQSILAALDAVEETS